MSSLDNYYDSFISATSNVFIYIFLYIKVMHALNIIILNTLQEMK